MMKNTKDMEQLTASELQALHAHISQTVTHAAQSPGGSTNGTGRRPVIIKDAQQRAMLHKIRDSLAHLQRNSLPSPGSDASG